MIFYPVIHQQGTWGFTYPCKKGTEGGRATPSSSPLTGGEQYQIPYWGIHFPRAKRWSIF